MKLHEKVLKYHMSKNAKSSSAVLDVVVPAAPPIARPQGAEEASIGTTLAAVHERAEGARFAREDKLVDGAVVALRLLAPRVAEH
jgi:hypothetical protein